MSQGFAKTLYASREWIELRRNLIIERGPVCQECGTVMVDTSKLIGHHTVTLTPQNVTDPKVTLNPALIRLVCHDCHNKQPHHFCRSKQRSVYLVYGSPCSGKMAIVNQMAERGDMILDIDSLFQAISGMGMHDKPNNLRFNVFALRDKMLDMIKTRYGEWHDAYIIGGYPSKGERERLAVELGAELIYCESTIDECNQRALADQVRGKEWAKWIEKWWRDFEP